MDERSRDRVLSRRTFVVLSARGLGSVGLLALAGGLPCSASASTKAESDHAGRADGARRAEDATGRDAAFALGDPDENGLRLLPGFRSRVVARSGEAVAGTSHVWHRDPDGGAVFARDDGGWIYVSNAESWIPGEGGVGAIRFDARGRIVDAYSILQGTTRNCAGGRTPWRTWLSCEEHPRGQVFECDPFRPGSQGEPRPALGLFQHEAVAVDPVRRRLYLTEDRPDGLLHRFTPERWPKLDRGRLEVARVEDVGSLLAGKPSDEGRTVRWLPVPDPLAKTAETRHQVPDATRFVGGEGIDYQPAASIGAKADRIVFSTKGDDRLWALDPASDRLEILYDRAQTPDAPLSGVDNVFAAPNGDLYVAEDGGDLQIVVRTPTGRLLPIAQVTGQPGSELTGPALSPDGRRLYFSSQRGPGTTYEVEGPFLSVTIAG